jgi:hypothetical protein
MSALVTIDYLADRREFITTTVGRNGSCHHGVCHVTENMRVKDRCFDDFDHHQQKYLWLQ